MPAGLLKKMRQSSNYSLWARQNIKTTFSFQKSATSPHFLPRTMYTCGFICPCVLSLCLRAFHSVVNMSQNVYLLLNSFIVALNWQFWFNRLFPKEDNSCEEKLTKHSNFGRFLNVWLHEGWHGMLEASKVFFFFACNNNTDSFWFWVKKNQKYRVY